MLLMDLFVRGTHLALRGAFLYLPIAIFAGCSSAIPIPPTPMPEATGELHNIE